MLPTDMNLKIRPRTAGYNNKILISDGPFSLDKNDKVNTFELAKEAIISKGRDKDIKVIVQPSLMKTELSLMKTQHRNKLSLMKMKKLP